MGSLPSSIGFSASLRPNNSGSGIGPSPLGLSSSVRGSQLSESLRAGQPVSLSGSPSIVPGLASLTRPPHYGQQKSSSLPISELPFLEVQFAEARPVPDIHQPLEGPLSKDRLLLG